MRLRKKQFKSISAWLILGIIGFSLFFAATPVLAQTLDTGLQYGTATGLGTGDLRVTVMNIVRVVLGFLGVLAIAIIAYGGFVWMTAGGNAQRIDTAKSILRNAVIGLVIILSSFMIVSFIIGQLIDATGAGEGGGEFSCTPNVCTATCGVRCNATGDGTVLDVSCDANCGGGGAACPKPSTVTPTICSIEARDGFGPGGVPQGAVGDFVTVEGWYFGDYDEASSNITFDGTQALIVECSETPSWTYREDDYGFVRIEIPEVTPNEVDPYDVVLSGLNGSSSASPYLVNSDNSGLPQLACVNPALGKNNDTLNNAEGRDFGATAGDLNFTFNESAAFSSWSDTEILSPVVPEFAMSGPVQVENSSGDLSNQVWFTVVCEDSLECGSGCCSNNQCAHPSACFEASEIPRINYVSPEDGAVGNFVTVGGDNFGTDPGVVEFYDGSSFIVASLADTVNGACADSVWTETEVVVVVPSGAADGPIKLTRGDNGLADQTNDSYGPVLEDFDVNSIVRPGICGVEPVSGEVGDAVAIYGTNFNNNEVYFGPEIADGTLTIAANQIDGSLVPEIGPGNLGIRVLDTDSSEFSNSKNFEVIGDGGPDDPDPSDFNCSADTEAPSCVVGDDTICDTVFGSGGLDYTCNPESCRCELESQSESKASAFTWFFGTTSQGPQVVESCNRTSSCDLGTHSSPSPFSRQGTSDAGYRVSFARQDDGAIPIDAIVSGMFNTKMFLPTLIGDNIKVYQCNGDADSTDFNPSECTSEVAGSLDIKECNYLDFVSTDAHCFDFTPGSLLPQNTWYKVEVNSQNILGQNGVNLVGNYDEDGDGVSEFYNWVFKTRDSDILSRVACLYVDPFASTSRFQGEEEVWTASGQAQDFVCVNMNISDADSCNWDASSWTSSDNIRAPLSDYTDENDVVVPNKKVSTALQETAADTPVEITAFCELEDPAAIVSGSGFLTIDFSKPVVVDRFPNCGAACTNALVGMTFSKPMEVTSVNNGTNLYICYDDPSCQNKVAVPGFVNDQVTNQDQTFTYVVFHDVDGDGEYESEGFDFNNDGIIDYYLLPNSYYQVVIDGTATSFDGETLGGLNYDSDGPDAEGNISLNSYAWTFKTKPNFELCLPGRVDVNPRSLNAPYDTTIPYEAVPHTVADSCSPSGQKLIPYSWNWEWESTDTSIATISAIAACGNGRVELGEDCDFGVENDADGLCDPVTCLHTGNSASCGNGIVEIGEECDDDGIYCDDSCLLTGNENNGPVCGNGIIEDIELCEKPGFIGCDSQCLLTGSVPGASRCGDGIIGAGEECDEGELAFGDSPSSGDYDGDGISCNASCLVENRTTSFCRSDIDNKFDFNASCTGNDDCTNGTCIALDVATGNTQTAPFPVCSNGVIEIGEECDPGPISVEYCTAECLNAGSFYEDPDFVGPYQLAQTTADTNLSGSTNINANIEGGEAIGTGILSVGNACIGELLVVEGYPNCGSACSNALAGARFCNEVDTTTLTAANIHLIECSDSNCLDFDPINDEISGINITPYASSCESSVIGGNPEEGCVPSFIDAFRIELPSTYNPISDFGRFLPNTTYRVVIEDGEDGVRADDEEGTLLTGLNFDFDGNSTLDSYSWTFTTRVTNELCRLGSVDILPNDITLGQDVIQGYYFQSRAAPDSCDPLFGQRINPWFYDWRAESILTSTGFDVSGDDTAAFFLSDVDNETPGEPGSLRDGCGNLHVEEGEDCDDGNLVSGDGCSGVDSANWVNVDAACQWEGTEDPVCGNGVLNYGEDCDDGNLDDNDGCSSVCLWEGSTGYVCLNNPALPSCDPTSVDADGNPNACSGNPDQCQLTPVCGNGIVEAPSEQCDNGNEPDGNDADGCTDFCTFSGGIPGVQAVCGDGVVNTEAGEQCDSGFLTGGSDPGCTEPTTDVGCGGLTQADCRADLACYWTGNACITRACLSVSNDYDINDPAKLGNDNYNTAICGNSDIEYGEECDGGLACSPSCLNTGSVGTDGQMDPYQVLKTNTVESSLLTRVNEEIRAWANLDPNVVGIGQLAVQLGANLDFTIINQQPESGAENQCRNAAIAVNFSNRINTDTLSGNVRVCPEGTDCSDPANSIVTSLNHVNIQGTCVETDPFVKECDWGDLSDPANLIAGSCETDRDCVGSRVVVSGLEDGFLGVGGYQVDVDSSIQDVSDNTLDCSTGNCNWEFSTANHFCECDFVGVSIDPTSGGSLTTQDLFTCAGNSCGDSTLTAADDDVDSGLDGNQHLYSASCFDVTNPTGQRIEIFGGGVTFEWLEIDPEEIIFLSNVLTGAELHYVTPGDSADDIYGKNGKAEVKVTAKEYKCAENNQLCVPDVTDCTCRETPSAHRFVEVTNFICANPWPNSENGIFKDNVGSGITCSGSGPCPATNFELFYCQDDGQPGEEDDLNSLIDPADISYLSGRSGTNILKDFIIPVCEGSQQCVTGETLPDSALAVRVLQNPLHLSPRTWYESGLCGGIPNIDNICFNNADCGAVNIFGNASFDEVTGADSVSCPGSIESNWTCEGSGTLSYAIDAARTGNLGARIPSGVQLISGPDIELDPGSYAASVYVRSGDKVRFNAEFAEGSNDHICTNANCDLVTPSQSSVCSNGTGDWEQVTCNFSLIGTTKVQFVVTPDSQTADIDDAFLSANSCQFNVPSRGNPQDIQVGNYEGLREGRSVYVSAANRSGSQLYSNIYLLSYDQGASPVVPEIINRILDPQQQSGAWNFNVNFTNHRVCGNGFYGDTNNDCPIENLGLSNSSDCQGLDQSSCNAAASLGCYWSVDSQDCLAHICQPVYCESDFDCPALDCRAAREEIVRDNIRYGDLRDIQISLENYKNQTGAYPVLGGGSYIEGTTFSIWPSWQQTLASSLGSGLPLDPLNRFTGCGEFYCDTNGNGVIDGDEADPDGNSCALNDITRCGGNIDSCLPLDPDEQTTCWDEVEQLFSCPVDGGFNYAYKAENNGLAYNLYTVFELEEPATWRTRDGETEPFYDLPVKNIAGGGMCQFENFEISDATVGGTGVAPTCNEKACYGGTNDPTIHSCDFITDCPDQGPGTLCSGDADQDGVCDLATTDNCSPRDFCAQNPEDCYNPDQTDSGGAPGVGDACDPSCSGDADSDGSCDEVDNCSTVYNPAQTDSDDDGIGDACDPCTDVDRDGWWDIDTGANDPFVCGADNCAPINRGVCVLPDGELTDERCFDFSDCSVFGSTCHVSFGAVGLCSIPTASGGFNPVGSGTPDCSSSQGCSEGEVCVFVGNFNVSNDANKYCHNGAEVFPIACTKGLPAAGTTCPKGENCCPTEAPTCQKTTGDLKYYNPFQEDFDDDLVGYICDACIDFDGDKFGDYSFYTGSANPALRDTLSANQLQHFSACQPTFNDFPNFTDTTVPAIGLPALDNCPAGPNGATCLDKFGGAISCSNPSPGAWIDFEGTVWSDGSQRDTNLNSVGDICDPTTALPSNCSDGPPFPEEVCNDLIDNDCDGDIDCLDSDCTGQTGFGGVVCCDPSLPDNVECGGVACQECNEASHTCQGVTKLNGVGCWGECSSCLLGSCVDRNIGDATECSAGEACAISGSGLACVAISTSPESNSEACGNGIDDDSDGKIDCQDPDCRGIVTSEGLTCCQNNSNCGSLTCSQCDLTTNICTGISADEGSNCTGECTRCSSGACLDRSIGDGIECPTGLACGDEDEDGTLSCDLAIGESIIYYPDIDGDTYFSDVQFSCLSSDPSCPPGNSQSTRGLDCDEDDAAINPEAIDICDDGIDQNCDGFDASCDLCGNDICDTEQGENSTNCEVDCPAGPADSCDDSDFNSIATETYKTIGTVTVTSGETSTNHPDLCSGGQLQETSCNPDDTLQTTSITCSDEFGSGWACQSGRCVQTALRYPDNDGDGFFSQTGITCTVGVDCPEPNSDTQGNDCNDDAANANPGIAEETALTCQDGLDNDCDDLADGDDPDCQVTYHIDNDGDGFFSEDSQICILGTADCPPADSSSSGNDCDDADSAVNPDAEENTVNLCTDGKDNNCNTLIDADDPSCQSLTVTHYPDEDGDGYFSATGVTCTLGVDCPGTVNEVQGDDCRDSKSSDPPSCPLDPANCATASTSLRNNCAICIHPDITWLDNSCNGVDNDCDELFDEDYAQNTIVTSCGVGECNQDGFLNCEQTEGGGTFDTCEPLPAGTEVCDPDNLDEDCDGESNESCECIDGETTSCSDFGRLGVCAEQTATCVGGAWDTSSCDVAVTENNTTADPLTCTDGVDNDCDGAIDCLDSGCSAISCSGSCVTASCNLSTFQWECSADTSVSCGGCGFCDETSPDNFSCAVDTSVSCSAGAGSCVECLPLGAGFECQNDPNACAEGEICNEGGFCEACPLGDTDGDGICDGVDVCPHEPSWIQGDNNAHNFDEGAESANYCQIGCRTLDGIANGGICGVEDPSILKVDNCLGGEDGGLFADSPGECVSGNSCKVVFGGGEYMSMYINGVYLAGNMGLGYPQSSGEAAPAFNPRSRLLNFKSGVPTVFTWFMPSEVLQSGANLIAIEGFSSNKDTFGVMGAFTNFDETALCGNLPATMIKRTSPGEFPTRCFAINDDLNVKPSSSWKTSASYDPATDPALSGLGITWETSAAGVQNSAATEFEARLAGSKFDFPTMIWDADRTFISNSHVYCQYVFTN